MAIMTPRDPMKGRGRGSRQASKGNVTRGKCQELLISPDRESPFFFGQMSLAVTQPRYNKLEGCRAEEINNLGPLVDVPIVTVTCASITIIVIVVVCIFSVMS